MPYPATNLYPQSSGLYPGDGVEVPPTVVTGAASAITSATANVTATVDPNDLQTHYYFEYGLGVGYGFTSTTGIAGSGSSPVSVARTLTGLTGGSHYHYRIVAYSAAGFAYGNDAVFNTDFGLNDPRPALLHDAGRGQ